MKSPILIIVAVVVGAFALGALSLGGASDAWAIGIGDVVKDTGKAVDASVRESSKESGRLKICRVAENEFRKGCVDSVANEVRYLECTERDSVIVNWGTAKLDGYKIGADCVSLTYDAYTKGGKSCPHNQIRAKADSRGNRYNPPCSAQ